MKLIGKASPQTEERPSYHHGNLRLKLIEVATELISRDGPSAVSLREAARLAGVSPAAPFRHFPTRAALIAAVAEEAMERFRREIDAAIASTPPGNPVARYRNIGVAYLRWAFANPTFFEVLSTKRLFDLDASARLSAANTEIQRELDRAFDEAADIGEIARADIPSIRLMGRGLVYGLARMKVDEQMGRWGVADGEALERAIDALDHFIALHRRAR